MLFLYLDPNIWYQSSRSWDFVVASETPWNFCCNFFSRMFQMEHLRGYLVDGSKYLWLKY
jgi:hypothetical protein